MKEESRLKRRFTGRKRQGLRTFPSVISRSSLPSFWAEK